MNIQAVATDKGLEILTDHVKERMKGYVIIGHTDPVNAEVDALVLNPNADYSDITPYLLYGGSLGSGGYDENGVLTFNLPLPYSPDFEAYIYGLGLVGLDGNGDDILLSISKTPKIAKAAGVGGTFVYKVAVRGEPGELIFRDTDYVFATLEEHKKGIIDYKATTPAGIKYAFEYFMANYKPAITKPTTPTATNGQGNITINTPLPEGATGIIVEQSSGSSWKEIYRGANSSVTITSLVDGMNFRSKGVAATVEGVWSDTFTYTEPFIGAFTLTATKNDTTANLSWTTAANALRYDVYKDNIKIADTSATSYDAINVTDNATFVVKAVCGVTMKDSNIVNFVYALPIHENDISGVNYAVPAGYTKCHYTLITDEYSNASSSNDAEICKNGAVMDSLFNMGHSGNQTHYGTFDVCGGDVIRGNTYGSDYNRVEITLTA